MEKKRTKKMSAQKEWAKERYQGMENLLIPSFAPDFRTISEEGIRHDIRNSIRHGFFSAMSIPVGVTTEEHKQFLKIACDEARGKILAGDIIGEKTLEDDMAMIAHAEKVGCTHLFISPNRSLQARTEEELYQGYVERISATSLPVVIYGSFSELYKNFGPGGVPLAVFDRLADLPNVVGIKLSQGLNLTTAIQICEKLSDRLLIGPVNLDFVTILAKRYPVQWSGQWNVESVQSPEKPYAVELMRLLNTRRLEEALKVYAQLEPALNAFYTLQAPLIVKGVHPWSHLKYYQWCTGGNGGLIRNLPGVPVPVLDAEARHLIRKTYRQVGIETTMAPEEEFPVGKAASARGARAEDLAETPYYQQA
ncbi:MAG: dihydrodipicolinate synthase family protein [Deltaproteobacteria bacterium]